MKRLGRGLAALGVMFVLVATAAAAAPGRTTLADDTVITAVQQAIQHSNDEQVQAIASRNVSLVTDSVTGDYAQQLTSTLQDMLDHHVTSIALLNLQWGQITVAADGSSAVVTTYETWRVVSTAGTVDDAPTRNEYTVVLDNGTWKIKSDAQTVGAPTPVATDAGRQQCAEVLLGRRGRRPPGTSGTSQERALRRASVASVWVRASTGWL